MVIEVFAKIKKKFLFFYLCESFIFCLYCFFQCVFVRVILSMQAKKKEEDSILCVRECLSFKILVICLDTQGTIFSILILMVALCVCVVVVVVVVVDDDDNRL